MSGKQIKISKRLVRREKDRILKEFLIYVQLHSFRDRFEICWKIMKRQLD